MPGDCRAGGVFDRRPAPLEIVCELPGRQGQLEPVAIAVEGDQVSLGSDLPDEIRTAPHLLPYQEDRRLVSRAREDLEHRRSPLLVWAIVKRQRDTRRFGERAGQSERA